MAVPPVPLGTQPFAGLNRSWIVAPIARLRVGGQNPCYSSLAWPQRDNWKLVTTTCLQRVRRLRVIGLHGHCNFVTNRPEIL
jgi:hypothetical protein